jgi:hypothetical protein
VHSRGAGRAGLLDLVGNVTDAGQVEFEGIAVAEPAADLHAATAQPDDELARLSSSEAGQVTGRDRVIGTHKA